MQDQHRHIDGFQVTTEIGFREGLDAFVMGLGAAHHALTPPVVDHPVNRFHAIAVEAIEGDRQVLVELGAIEAGLLAQAVEDRDRQTEREGLSLQHDRRDGADQYGFRHPAIAAELRHITGHFTATGRVTDMDGVLQVEMFNDRMGVSGVMIHIMAFADLRRPAMAATIMRHNAKALVDEIHHLRIPVVGRQGPAVVEDEGLSLLRAPILEIDLGAVLSGDKMAAGHLIGSFGGF